MNRLFISVVLLVACTSCDQKPKQSQTDQVEVCEVHRIPLKKVTAYLPDPILCVSPATGIMEFNAQFGDRYPHLTPWAYRSKPGEDWNRVTAIVVCNECDKAYASDFAAYMKIDEKKRWDEYVEFLGKKGRRERDTVNPEVDGDGSHTEPGSSNSPEKLHLPPLIFRPLKN